MRLQKFAAVGILGAIAVAGCGGGNGNKLSPTTNKGTIAFTSFPTGQDAIRIADGDGKNIRTLYTGRFVSPSIGRDGKIVFGTYDPAPINPASNEIFLGDVRGAPARKISPVSGNNFVNPHLSSDGKKVLCLIRSATLNFDLYLFALDGSQSNRLVTPPGDALSPSFSPDAKKIAYTLESPGGGTRKIYVANSDGSNPQRLTTTAGSENDPCFSRDGKKIVFTASDKLDGSYDIYEIDLATKKETRLTSDPGDEFTPLYSPDGTQIAYSSFSGKGTFVMNRDGSHATKIISDGFAKSWE